MKEKWFFNSQPPNNRNNLITFHVQYFMAQKTCRKTCYTFCTRATLFIEKKVEKKWKKKKKNSTSEPWRCFRYNFSLKFRTKHFPDSPTWKDKNRIIHAFMYRLIFMGPLLQRPVHRIILAKSFTPNCKKCFWMLTAPRRLRETRLIRNFNFINEINDLLVKFCFL